MNLAVTCLSTFWCLECLCEAWSCSRHFASWGNENVDEIFKEWCRRKKDPGFCGHNWTSVPQSGLPITRFLLWEKKIISFLKVTVDCVPYCQTQITWVSIKYKPNSIASLHFHVEQFCSHAPLFPWKILAPEIFKVRLIDWVDKFKCSFYFWLCFIFIVKHYLLA